MECKKLGELGQGGLLILENSRLVGQDGTHVSAEGLHILGKEDSVLLGFILEGIKAVSEDEHRVLKVKGGTGWGRPRGQLWEWWVCG